MDPIYVSSTRSQGCHSVGATITFRDTMGGERASQRVVIRRMPEGGE
jgi:hypothetical protein